MAPIHLHVHVDPGVTTDVHVHVYPSGDGTFGWTLDEREFDDGPDADEPTTAEDDAVEAIYKRFEAYDPGTPAREVGARLSDLGYTPYAPRHRASSQTKSAYLRWVYSGGSRKVSLFMNTGALISDRDRDRQFMAAQPGADVRGEKGRVHFFLADENGVQQALVDQALAAAAALRADADR